eukprot:CAMPEP_0177178176 /NCGR_PEP_ID=MMETSP0367-20130122/14192_1 /TAXON_ID=447022 ORGANISM="Scrippsiella hangoei-like, Strain SHHI-4" /NCGR_SAMPLE_ID=MMETSP0367 /ASSEMBLY_ACC=CAM_ASM_000362 /LENGTH=286 /DNA_ID=CAMNT_0018624823 /DNA_START=85 /DNA_END=945 /DNA_ORIENTATION=+
MTMACGPACVAQTAYPHEGRQRSRRVRRVGREQRQPRQAAWWPEEVQVKVSVQHSVGEYPVEVGCIWDPTQFFGREAYLQMLAPQPSHVPPAAGTFAAPCSGAAAKPCDIQACTPQQPAEGAQVVGACDVPVIVGLIGALENIAASAEPPVVMTRFHCKKAPAVSIERYVLRIREYFGCSEECFVLALVYIDRVMKHHPAYAFGQLSGHRMVLSAMVLAIKFLDDNFLSNKFYARVGGLQVTELNTLEIKMMKLLNYRLLVVPEEFEVYRSVLFKAGATALAADTN